MDGQSSGDSSKETRVKRQKGGFSPLPETCEDRNWQERGTHDQGEGRDFVTHITGGEGGRRSYEGEDNPVSRVIFIR